MRVSSALAGFVVALAVACPSACVFAKDAEPTAAAPEKHLLRYKFAMGEVLRYDVRHATNLRTTMGDTSESLSTHSDSQKSWKVTDVLPNGEMEFMHLVDWVNMTNEKSGEPTRHFDSRTDAKPPRGFEQVASSIGVPLSLIRISGDGEVTFRERKHPQPQPEEDMPITLQLPKERVAVGEKWNHAYDVVADRRSGGQQQVRTRRVCTLRQVKSGVAVIDVEYQILTPVEPYVRSQIKEKLTKGTVRFDVERGRILEQEHRADVRVLKFYGEASSVHFASKLQEKLLKPTEEVSQAQHVSAASK